MQTINFSDLLDDGSGYKVQIDTSRINIIDKKRTSSKVIYFDDITETPKKKLSTAERKEQKAELHKIEPGYKIPVLSVGTIVGTWCDHCDDMTMQVLKFDGSKIRCLDCKKDKILKKK